MPGNDENESDARNVSKRLGRVLAVLSLECTQGAHVNKRAHQERDMDNVCAERSPSAQVGDGCHVLSR
jgi:hypothetical protein